MGFRTAFDLSVYFVLDPAACSGRDPLDVAAKAIAGGVTMLQLRDKSADKDVMLELAQSLRALAAKASIPFLVNDHVDIALKSGADGVHLGQGDMPPQSARKLLGPDKIIGLTAFTPEHFQKLDPEIVDYAGTGPFFPTHTDKGKPVLGAEKFTALVRLSPIPVVGIGGIHPANAPEVLACGASGVAMMRSISEAKDPQEATGSFVILVQHKEAI